MGARPRPANDYAMKCISIRQPWASLIVAHGKDIENRNWPTTYRGPLLIHASSTKKATEWWGAIELCRRNGIEFVLEPGSVPMGAIIGVVDLVGCVEASPSPWFVGRYGFELANARPLPMLTMRGRLGLFEVAYQLPEVQHAGA